MAIAVVSNEDTSIAITVERDGNAGAVCISNGGRFPMTHAEPASRPNRKRVESAGEAIARIQELRQKAATLADLATAIERELLLLVQDWAASTVEETKRIEAQDGS